MRNKGFVFAFRQSRASAALRAALILGLFAPGCARCTDEAPPANESTSTATARPHRPVPDDVPTPTIEQLPLPQDFGEHAGQTVTDENYRAELERIAHEIAAAAPAESPEPTAPSEPAGSR
jgi:hypothetical protein